MLRKRETLDRELSIRHPIDRVIAEYGIVVTFEKLDNESETLGSLLSRSGAISTLYPRYCTLIALLFAMHSRRGLD